MQQEQTNSAFDFEAWMHLAKSDPEAFEAKRREEIQRALDKSPAHLKQRLVGLQWRIDMERSRCDTPIASCVRLFDMMWDGVYGENGMLDALHAVTRARLESVVKMAQAPQPAVIVNFKSRSQRA